MKMGKLLRCSLMIAFFTVSSYPAISDDNHHSAHTNELIASTISLSLSSTAPLIAGKENQIIFRLFKNPNNVPISLAELKEIHTQKIHVLINNQSLSDYHHVHPLPTATEGEYVFAFIPAKQGIYKMWADITPLTTSQEELLVASLKGEQDKEQPIDKMVQMVSSINNLIFKLSFDKPKLKIGEASIGTISVSTKENLPFTELEPVMGAYAHIVAFNEDFNTLSHIHPIGTIPTKISDRGGPNLSFHIEPVKAGFTKIYAQVKIDGKEVFVPFGVKVE